MAEEPPDQGFNYPSWILPPTSNKICYLYNLQIIQRGVIKLKKSIHRDLAVGDHAVLAVRRYQLCGSIRLFTAAE
jgi:hypothetical protein